jgi:hypothetical protein
MYNKNRDGSSARARENGEVDGPRSEDERILSWNP